MHQIAMPVDLSSVEVSRELTLGGAIDLCLKVAGKEAKQVTEDLKFDKAQISRWQSGQEGVNWPKLTALMDYCGNEAPLLWMAHARRYDLNSMRKLETEVERQNRLLREENAALKRVLMGAQA